MPAAVEATFVDLCREELVLCGVEAGSSVAVLSQADQRKSYADAFLAAAEQLGADAFHVRLKNQDSGLDGDVGTWSVGTTPLAGNRGAIEALKTADLVIDTIFLLFSAEQHEIQASGTRILVCIEPVEHLREMFPTRRLGERVQLAGALLGAARELRVTSPHGTDVTYRLGSYPVVAQQGFTDRAGGWDHWPSGFVFTGGADDGVDGKVVIAPGDILFPFKSYVQTAIELTIVAGRIVAIEGGHDADLLRDYIEGFGDPDAYGIAHIGWGMLETARWGALATDRRGQGMHGRSFYGNVLFSTGPNAELGGPNRTPCHVDVPMRNCSLHLDGRAIVVDGEIVVAELQADRRTGSSS